MNNVTQNERFENMQQEESVSKSIKNFCKTYKLGGALKSANAYKAKGIAIVEIFVYLLQLVYTNKSMFMNILTGTHKEQFAKDVVYRLLNSPNINWCRFMLIMASNVITTTINGLTSEERLNAIAIDDTFYARLRSKKVELLANVFDHASKGQKYKKGFRLLTFAWTDGATLIPLMFRHLSTENKKCHYNEANEKIDKRTAGYKARKQAVTKGTSVVIELLVQAVKMGIPAKHVIFDLWFSNPTTIIDIKKIGLDVVGRLKNTPTIKYLVNETEMTLTQIYKSSKKRRGLSKYLLSMPVQIYMKDSNTTNGQI
jgi:hypothetical protein